MGHADLQRSRNQAVFSRHESTVYAAGSAQRFARPFLNSGIQVVSAAAANAVPVAEDTVAQILLANKGFYQNIRMASTDRDLASVFFRSFPVNYHVKVGLLGAGAISSRVVQLLQPFALDLLVYDPYLPEQQAEVWGVCKTGLDELFASCQTISNHLANLPATRGMLHAITLPMLETMA